MPVTIALDEDEDDDDDEKEEVGEEEGDDVGEEEDDSSDDGTPGRVNEHLRGESPNSAELRAIEGEEFMKARDWVMRGGLRLADKARDTGEVDDEQHESKTEEKMEGDSDDAEGSGEEEQGGEGEGKKKDKEVT